MLNMACTLFRLTPEEALAGVTTACGARPGAARPRHARAGQRADIALWEIVMPAELCYRIGGNRVPRHRARGARRALGGWMTLCEIERGGYAARRRHSARGDLRA